MNYWVIMGIKLTFYVLMLVATSLLSILAGISAQGGDMSLILWLALVVLGLSLAWFGISIPKTRWFSIMIVGTCWLLPIIFSTIEVVEIIIVGPALLILAVILAYFLAKKQN